MATIRTGGFNKQARTDLPPLEERGVDITQLSPEAREEYLAKQNEKQRVEAVTVPSNHVERLKNVLDCPQEDTVRMKIEVADDRFMPRYQTKNSVCADVFANITGGSFSIPSRTQVVVDCGFNIDVPDGWQVVFSLKENLAELGIVSNTRIVGPGDNQSVNLFLSNIGKGIVVINHGDCIAQMQPVRVSKFDFGV